MIRSSNRSELLHTSGGEVGPLQTQLANKLQAASLVIPEAVAGAGGIVYFKVSSSIRL